MVNIEEMCAALNARSKAIHDLEARWIVRGELLTDFELEEMALRRVGWYAAYEIDFIDDAMDRPYLPPAWIDEIEAETEHRSFIKYIIGDRHGVIRIDPEGRGLSFTGEAGEGYCIGHWRSFLADRIAARADEIGLDVQPIN